MESSRTGRLGHTDKSWGEGQFSGGSPLSSTGQIASRSTRRRWLVVGASAIFIVLAFMVSQNLETNPLAYSGEGESAKAADLITDRSDAIEPPTEEGFSSNLSLDVNNPAYRSTVEGLVQDLRALPGVESVAISYNTQDPGSSSISKQIEGVVCHGRRYKCSPTWNSQ